MNRMPWVVLCTVIAWGCVDSGCPKGSEEIDGTCTEVNESPAMGDGGGGKAGTGSGAGSGGAGANPMSGTGGGGAGADSGVAGSGGGNADSGTPNPDASDNLPDTGEPQAGAEAPVICDDITCGADAFCEETAAGAQCACSPGFTGDGQSCVDDDECTLGTGDCDDNATCTNEPGTFACACNVGYEGSGLSCTRNPCEPRANPCDAETTTCKDEAGQAVCDCLAGRARCDDDAFACTTDVTSDRENCGACDLQCAGALACEHGECEQAAVALSLGTRHSCAITGDGAVKCWGANDQQQLLHTTTTPRVFEPVVADIGGPAAHLDAGDNFTCALLLNRHFVCWGSNYAGRIAGPGAQNGLFELDSNANQISQISAGQTASCVIVGGFCECWGVNSGDQLGNPSIDENAQVLWSDPVRVDLVNPLGVSMGSRKACALTGGQVKCWGGGNGTPASIVDSANTAISGVQAVATNYGSTADVGCALTDAGRVMCWGGNELGQLGNPSNATSSVNFAVPVTDSSGQPLADAVEIAVGWQHACARRANGSVVCWGRRDRLGNGNSGATAQRSYVSVTGVDDAVGIAVGAYHSCLRRATGQVQCWGDNAYGQSGVFYDGTSGMAAVLTPVNVTGLP